MALTEAYGEDGASESEIELERQVLESEQISTGGSPDDLINAMTRTLAPRTMALEGQGQGEGEREVEHTQIEVYNSGQPGDRSGEVIHGRYQLVRQLGKGGMGTVYIARHTTLPKTFAVKVLNSRYAKRKDIAERFLQEARAVSLINHENVVGVIDFGREDDGSAFLVMEHLRGESLAALCKREAPLPWARVRHIMLQLCRALQAAHAAGIVHRDIKPENVLRVGRHDDLDFIKVLDFGLAKLQVSGGLRLTQTGMVLGTPDYMSPEQARGRPTDHRTDIYAAGVMMYELLCARVPFQAKTFQAMRQKHLLEPPEPPSKWAPEAGISDEMDAIVLRALAKDPAHRFASMTEMGEAIEAVGTGKGAVELIERRTLPLLAERTVLGPRGPAPTLPTVAPTVAIAQADTLVADDRGGSSDRSTTSASPGHSRAYLAFALIGVAALIGVVTAAFATGALDRTPAPELPRQAEPAAAPAAAAETDDGQAVLRFETNVPVVVVDIDAGARFGEQPVEEVVVPRSDEPLRLVLQAEGYRDLHVVIRPDRDQILEAELERTPAAAPEATTEAEAREQPESAAEPPAPERRPTKSSTGGPKPKPPDPEPKTAEDDETPEHSFSPEIVDPFGKKNK